MLKIDHVTFSYGDKKKLSYDFEFLKGQPVALMGESGIGKTTLLNLIAGFLKPISGDIFWKEESWKSLSTRERPVSYLMQDAPLFDHLSVQQNILLSRASLEEVIETVQALGIQELLRHKAGDLSGGQRQRVLLAQTLLQRRSIVLLDEPFKGLDKDNKRKASEVIRSLTTAKDQLLIITTHDQKEARALGADEYFLIKKKPV